jgi:hypothetical protein
VLAPQFIAQYAPVVGYEDVGIFVSQSGETKDVLNALEIAEKRGMACYGLANVIGSTLTRATSFCLPLCCGYEISKPATSLHEPGHHLPVPCVPDGRATPAIGRIPERRDNERQVQVEAIARAS